MQAAGRTQFSMPRLVQMVTAYRPQYIEFIARLRQARKARSISQVELGGRLNKPQAFVSKVETCERRLDLVEAAEWCIALGIKLDAVLPANLRASLQATQDDDAPEAT